MITPGNEYKAPSKVLCLSRDWQLLISTASTLLTRAKLGWTISASSAMILNIVPITFPPPFPRDEFGTDKLCSHLLPTTLVTKCFLIMKMKLSQFIFCFKKRKKRINRKLSLLTAASVPPVAGVAWGHCWQLRPCFRDEACVSHGGPAVPGPFPGLLGSSSFICSTSLALRFVLGTKRDKKLCPCFQASGRERNDHRQAGCSGSRL